MSGLEDDSFIRKVVQDHPLLMFSIYTEIQVNIVRGLDNQILADLDKALVEGEGSGVALNDAYGHFWLWVLGSYEIVRTMVEIGNLSPELLTKVKDFKDHVSALRMPFAKQQYENPRGSRENKPIAGEASIYSFDIPGKDLIFDVRGTKFRMRDMVRRFEALMAGVRSEDVL